MMYEKLHSEELHQLLGLSARNDNIIAGGLSVAPTMLQVNTIHCKKYCQCKASRKRNSQTKSVTYSYVLSANRPTIDPDRISDLNGWSVLPRRSLLGAPLPDIFGQTFGCRTCHVMTCSVVHRCLAILLSSHKPNCREALSAWEPNHTDSRSSIYSRAEARLSQGQLYNHHLQNIGAFILIHVL